MGYRFPKSKFRQSSITDPSELRFQIQSAQEELTFLNEHNIKAGTFPAERRADALLYDFHYSDISADLDIGAPDYVPLTTDPNAMRIPDSGEWVAMTGLTQTWTGGEDRIWAIGWAQYGLVTTGSLTNFAVAGTTITIPRIQFCVRVNGAIIPESVTGTERPDEPSTFLALPNEPITKLPANFVTLDQRKTPGTGALGWHVRATRVQSNISVPQGEVTVEFCARRVAPNDAQTSIGEIQPVYVFSRKACVIQMKRSGSGAFPDAALPPLTYPDDGDALSYATVYTGVLEPMKETINALLPGNIQMWGLRREHLPTGGQVQEVKQTSQLSGDTTAIKYPGYGSDGDVTAGDWAEVVDSSGNNLRVDGPWDYTQDPAFVLILANVAFTKASSTFAAMPEVYGVYAIAGEFDTGVPFKDAGAEGFTNNPNVMPVPSAPGGLANRDCDTDVPLLMFYDFRATPPADIVNFYRVIATWDGVGATGENIWDRGSIQVFHFRP